MRSPSTSLPTAWVGEFVLLASLWGASFLFLRIGVGEFGVFPTAAVRVLIASLFLLPLLWLRGLGPELRRHYKPVLLVGLLNSAVPFASFSFALQSISTGLTSLLNATTPLFGALIAWLWLREGLTRLRVLGLLIGFAGIALLAWDKIGLKSGASAMAAALAIGACLLATLCYGISASFTKRHLTGVPPLVIATGSQLGAALALVLPAVWLWPAQMPGANAWLALLAVGVVCTGFAYVLFFRLIAHAGPARAMTVTFLIPVFAVLYGVLLLGESVSAWMVGCAAVILLGTFLSTGLLGEKRRG